MYVCVHAGMYVRVFRNVRVSRAHVYNNRNVNHHGLSHSKKHKSQQKTKKLLRDINRTFEACTVTLQTNIHCSTRTVTVCFITSIHSIDEPEPDIYACTRIIALKPSIGSMALMCNALCVHVHDKQQYVSSDTTCSNSTHVYMHVLVSVHIHVRSKCTCTYLNNIERPACMHVCMHMYIPVCI